MTVSPLWRSLSTSSNRDDSHFCTTGKWPTIEVPLRNVLWAELAGDVLEVSLLAKQTVKAPLSLVHIAGKVDPAVKDEASAFTQSLMRAAYGNFGKDVGMSF